MGIILPTGGKQATLRWTLSGDPDEMVSTLGIDHEGFMTPDELAHEVYIAATTAGSLCVAANMFNLYTFVGVTAHFQTLGGLLVGEWVAPVVGTGGGNPLPSNCAILVHKRTQLGGRRGRGRMYLPAFTAGELDVNASGTIDTVDHAAIQAELGVFRTTLVANDVPPMLYHSDGGAGTEITNLVLDTRIGTQRRRMR